VIKEDAVAFVHRSKRLLRKRISHAGPFCTAIVHEVVKAAVGRLFLTSQFVMDFLKAK
jgi:hypothetical protein